MNEFKELFFLNLTSEAKCSIKQRQYANLHLTHHEKCQRLFNAIECDSYIQPHRHSLDRKIETLLAVKGLFALIQFSDTGAIKAVSFLCSESHITRDADMYGVEILPNEWHTLIAMSPNAVLFEVKEGPFVSEVAKEVAPWAPKEDSAEATQYFQSLKAEVQTWQY
jgi:cupin fold WbuC family metalloprotein